MSPTIVMPIGATAPAPNPWITRKTMSDVMLHAHPASTEETRNSPTPVRITGLRPYMSESLEKIGTLTACANM